MASSAANLMRGTGFTASFTDTMNYGAQVGQNFGSIVNNFNRRPETPPSPSSFVPFPRDPHFVDRGTLLDEIHERCFTRTSWTALVGLGGVGKSQLAIEYSHRLNKQSPDRWIFWIHTGNAARFTQDFQEVANTVKIPERHHPQVNICSLVYDWLRDQRNGKWLLILDNLDDAEFLFETHQQSQTSHVSGNHIGRSKPLIDYLPRNSNGSILITTRTKDVAVRLVEESDMISVEPMDKEQAIGLLRQKLEKLRLPENDPDVGELVCALEFMPLAVVQAGAYISQRAPRCTIRQYMQQFQKSDKGKETLLNHEGGNLRRDRDAKNSIIITWQISFDHIRHTRPSAADLLSLMSFFDRQGIPENLLRNRGETNGGRENAGADGNGEENDEDSSSESNNTDDFEEDLLTLRNYSFVSVNVDGASFEMHSLVQLSTRKWLESHGQLEKWKQQYIEHLDEDFPEGDYETWAKCRALFPHVKAALVHKPKTEAALLEWASLLYRAAKYALRGENIADAARMSTTSMTARKNVLGVEHEATVSSMELVGETSQRGGRWREAEELATQIMETRKRNLGNNDPSTLVSMNNLALTFLQQGRWAEAEVLLEPLPRKLTKVFGPVHPFSLTSKANLALTYRNQGRWKEAEELLVSTVETMKKALGIEHPDVLENMCLLGSIYIDQGRWTKAEELLIPLTGKMEKVYGLEHPSSLASMGNLASIYVNQGRWKEAEKLLISVVEKTKELLGPEHPSRLTNMTNLASTYREQGRWTEAEELAVQVVETSSRVLGAEHPNTLTSMGNLASTYWEQGRWTEAEQLEVQVVEMRSRVLGAEHPNTLTSMGNLASTYRSQGRWAEAEELAVQVMETSSRVLGAEHRDTLANMANLASTYSNQGRWAEAEELEVQVVEISSRVLGAKHPSTLISIGNLASMFSNQGRWMEAEELTVQVMETSSRVLGAEHPDTLTSMNNLAWTWKGQGKTAEAIKLMEECLRLRSQVLGIDHPDTRSSSASLARWKMQDMDVDRLAIESEEKTT